MGKTKPKYSGQWGRMRLTNKPETTTTASKKACPLCPHKSAYHSNIRRYLETQHGLPPATRLDTIVTFSTDQVRQRNTTATLNTEKESNAVEDEQEARAEIEEMMNEEQEIVMGEDLLSLKERIFNLTVSDNDDDNGILQNQDDLPTLAFEDCQSLLDLSAAPGEWNRIVPPFFPFPSLQALVLHAFVDRDDSMIAVTMLTKIMYTINLLFELKKKADNANAEFKLPTVNSLLNYQDNKLNKVPLFPTTVKKVTIKATSNLGSGITGQEKTVDCHFNLPSDHLRLLLANPQKAPYLSALPNFTEDQCISVQQGEKWRSDPLFQYPYLNVDGKDFWVGDVAFMTSGQFVLIDKLFTRDGLTCVSGFFVEVKKDRQDNCLYCVQNFPCSYEVKYLQSALAPPSIFGNSVDWYTNGQTSLTPAHHRLLFKAHPLKKPVRNNAGQFILFQKAIIAPLAIFSDDTSGNLMKTHGMYDSVLVNFPAMPYSMRNKRENNFFVTAVSQQAGFKATHLMPVIAADIKSLETGLDMYSSVYNETITVCAPLLFITADNARHAELVGLKHATSCFPCRKCYYRSLTRISPNNITSGHHFRCCQERTKEDYITAANDPTRKEKVVSCTQLDTANLYLYVEKRTETIFTFAELGYAYNGTEDLLSLQSFDPALDTPVEILHTMALGVCKYLVNHLFKEVLKGDAAAQVKLSDLLEQEKGSRDFTRTFRKKLRHSGSYLGKEYKILAQVLPLILNAEFANNPKAMRIAKPLTELGVLSSLLFVREISSGFVQYLNNVDAAAHRFVQSLYDYDVLEKTKFSLTLKTHLLLHLKTDIKRFGCALHFETEKGEQFNKFIGTHLVYSNRRADNRDLTVKFGKQDMLRHITDEGSWIDRSTGNRVQSGSGVIDFLRGQRSDFNDNYFGKRLEFVDNNHVSMKIVPGVSVAFSFIHNANRKLYVGKVVKDNDLVYIQLYSLLPSTLNFASVACQATDYYYRLEETRVECMMHFTANNNQPVLNLCKFGSYRFYGDNLPRFFHPVQ